MRHRPVPSLFFSAQDLSDHLDRVTIQYLIQWLFLEQAFVTSTSTSSSLSLNCNPDLPRQQPHDDRTNLPATARQSVSKCRNINLFLSFQRYRLQGELTRPLMGSEFLVRLAGHRPAAKHCQPAHANKHSSSPIMLLISRQNNPLHL